MKFVEKAGLVKFDFLGLKTLTVLSKAENLIKEKIQNFNLTEISLDDKKTFQMLSSGSTTGVFQLESAGMKDVLIGLKPDRFEDIIAVVSCIDQVQWKIFQLTLIENMVKKKLYICISLRRNFERNIWYFYLSRTGFKGSSNISRIFL